MKSYDLVMSVVLFICACFPGALAADLGQCIDNLLHQEGWNGTSFDSEWDRLSKNITYEQCKKHCGAGLGTFFWSNFSSNFTTWLLPWIALIFQLPFGADDRLDNLVAVFLAVGSPALAGYSLVITRLNGRWLAKQFNDRVKFPNQRLVPVAFAALQHIPIRISEHGALLPSLVVLPENDLWWFSMARSARKTRGLTIPAAMNILWVLVACILTIIDSLTSVVASSMGGSGFAVTALWSYLLALVIGWLNVGSQHEANHFRTALEESNVNSWVATPEGSVPVSNIAGRPSNAIEYGSRLTTRLLNDERRSAPIFNYARVFLWSQQGERIVELYENASEKAEQKITVSGCDWTSGDDGLDRRNRAAATDIQVIRYCTESDDPSIVDMVGLTPISDTGPRGAIKFEPSLPYHFSQLAPHRSLWASHVLERIAFAVILALILQWGSTGAAVMIHAITPPVGIGCRSMLFLLYGIVGTVVLFLILLSSFLAHQVRPSRKNARLCVKGVAAITLRWAGKTLGILNAIGIITSSTMQFTGSFDNCFCVYTIFGKGTYVQGFQHWLTIWVGDVIKFWIGGLLMAFGCGAIFTAALYVSSPMNFD